MMRIRKCAGSERTFHKTAFYIGIFLFIALLLPNVDPVYAQGGAQAPGVTQNSIKIGVFAPFTGPISVYGKAAHMADAIFKKVNETGGINGRKIEAILEDTAADPIKGVAAVKKLIHQDGVFMLHGGMASNVCLAAKKDILETGIPYVVLGAASHKITSPLEKNIFTGVFTSLGVSHSMADFAMSKPGVKKVGIIKHTDEWAKSFYEPLLEHLEKKYNVKPSIDETIERTATDATPQILKLKQANPDVIIAITYVESTSTLLRDAHKLGMKIPIVGSPAVAVDEQFGRVGIPDAMAQFFAPYWYKYPFDHPEMKKWESLLTKEYPKDTFDMFAAIGVGGTITIVEALKKAGPNLNWSSFLNALEGMSDLKEWSALPYPMATPITFSATDHVGIDKVAFSVLSLPDKKLKVVYGWKDFEKK